MKIAKTRNVKTPVRGTELSAGLDFFIPNDFEVTALNPGKSINIPSGIKAEIPPGHALIAMNKSGIALNKGVQVGACVIDEDYQGEIHLHIFNVSNTTIVLTPGLKLIQFLCIPVYYTDIEEVDIDNMHTTVTQRGEGNFGSTGGGG